MTTAEGDDALSLDGCLALGIDEDEVGIVAFAQVASLLDSEELGRAVCHFLHDQLLREYAFASHVKHGDECILRERASAGCGEAVAFLLREECGRGQWLRCRRVPSERLHEALHDLGGS